MMRKEDSRTHYQLHMMARQGFAQLSDFVNWTHGTEGCGITDKPLLEYQVKDSDA